MDRDMVALDKASDALGPELKSLGASASKVQAQAVAKTAIFSWLSNRVVEWSKDRAVSGFGSPDAYTVGFAMAILPVLGGGEFPFEKPIGDWGKLEMAEFLATAFELMESQRVATLERDDLMPF